MKNKGIVIVVVLILGGLLYWQASVKSKSEMESFALQEKCAKNAEEFFNYFVTDLTKRQTDEFSNHYNLKLNKCFVLITHYMGNAHGMYTQDLYDAVEKKVYGSYAWQSQDGKKFWEVPPITCEMLGKTCFSEDEFNAFVKDYMQEK